MMQRDCLIADAARAALACAAFPFALVWAALVAIMSRD